MIDASTVYHIIYIYIIYYIIKVGFKSYGCAKWFHQNVEIFIDFFLKNRYNFFVLIFLSYNR